jgi:small-conductance mechanosensitive channel
MVGSLAGQFAGGAASRAAREAGIDYAGALGNLVSMLILFIAGIMALSQLKIHTDIIRLVTLCTLAGLALAFGLSFGLGTREITRNIVAGFYARKLFRTGEEIEIRGERGILKAITPTQALLEQDSKTVAIANSTFLEEVVRQ